MNTRPLRYRFPSVPAGYPVRLNCTVSRHKQLGTHAVINARSGQAWRNDVEGKWSAPRTERKLRARGRTSECPWCGRPVPFSFNHERRFCDGDCRRSYYF